MVVLLSMISLFDSKGKITPSKESCLRHPAKLKLLIDNSPFNQNLKTNGI